MVSRGLTRGFRFQSGRRPGVLHVNVSDRPAGRSERCPPPTQAPAVSTATWTPSAADGSAQGFSVSRGTPTTPKISNLPASGNSGGGFTAAVSTTGDGVASATPLVCKRRAWTGS